MPFGYRPATVGPALVPVTSPGLPIVMMAARAIAGHPAVFVVTPLAGAACIWLTFLIGRRWRSPRTGLIAALLVASNPVFLFMLMWPMTDMPAAAVIALIVWLLLRGDDARTTDALAAGVAAAFAILLRPNLLFIAVAAGAWLVLDALVWRRGARAWTRVLLYAWCPLPVLEFWATGHNDSFPILFTALAFVAAARERWTWSFAALSLAAAAKLWPLLLFPVFIGWTNGRPARWFQWWITVPIMGLLAMPYWSDVWENARVLTGFLGGWRNNDSLFGILLWAATDIYLAKKIAFGIVCGTALFVTLLRLPLERAALWILTVTLMVASNCHPWYLTWILPLLAFIPVPALLLWTTLIPLAYVSVINWSLLGQWHGSGEFRWFQYVPVYGLLAGSWIVGRYRYRQPTVEEL
jgi:hypothetical protein